MAAIEIKRSSPWVQPPGLVVPLSALQHVRKMRGRTQAHLMRASDEHLYVVKFQNNPIHPRLLANDFFATRLGLWLGLPMSNVELIEVSNWLIAHTPELRMDLYESRVPCSSGLQFASHYLAETGSEILNELPRPTLQQITNPQDWARVLAFDKWVGNCDSRQVVFVRKADQTQFNLMFVDQGDSFNAERWNFPDLPLHSTYEHYLVYQSVIGWDSFEPVLSRIENIDSNDLWRLALELPQEWYQYDSEELSRLVEALHGRRALVRGLITNLRQSLTRPFPNWT